jgi:hypothetical protein
MSRPLPILDEDRPARDGTDSMISWVQSLTVQLPKLSPMALQSQAFDFYDRSLKDGEPTAAALAAGIMQVLHLEQKDAAARRSEWSRSRCVEFLRSEIFRLNKELVDVAQRTKSDAVRVAVIDTIYRAIIANYPHLKNEASDAAVRRKLELTKSAKNGAAIERQTVELEPHKATLEAPKVTLAEAKQDAADDGEADMLQLAHAQLQALRTVHFYLIPRAAAEGITIDALQANGLVQNLLIQSYYQRSHTKFSRTKLEGSH